MEKKILNNQLRRSHGEILNRQWLKELKDTDNRIPILDDASITAIRERVRAIGEQAELPPTTIENVAVIATELGRNQLLHAKMGEMAVRPISTLGVPGIEVIAADQGEGIEDPAGALRGNYSTSGTLGAGLSSVHRLADELDFDIRLGEGTCIWSRNFAKPPPTHMCCELAIMGRAFPGEVISGDAGFFLRQNASVLVGVADGLGHGFLAHEASFEAVQCVQERPNRTLDSMLLQCNEHLSQTRGAAMSLARLHADTATVESLGFGDVSTHLYHRDKHRRFLTFPHVLGHPLESRFPAPETVPFSAGEVLLLFTDGLRTETDLSGRLEVMRQPAIAIAQTLLHEFARPNDDALIFVAKFKRMR